MRRLGGFMFVLMLILAAFSPSAQASLIDRGGGMIYDTVLDITLLQDANYAKTSGYSAANQYGGMTWFEADAWAKQLSYGGYTDWRLLNPERPFYRSSDGWNGGEFAQLFMGENISKSHPGPFMNLGSIYWSNQYIKYPGWEAAWTFNMTDGSHGPYGPNIEFLAWAVRDGDVAATPIPGGVWLLGSGLACLLGLRKKLAR